MEILGKLFGSEARVKIIRLFLFNQEDAFDIKDISQRSKVNKGIAKKDTENLVKAGLLRKKTFYKTVLKKKGKKKIEKKAKSKGYVLNTGFPYLNPLRQLLISGKNFKGEELVKKLSKAGKLKLVIVAGVFNHDENSRLDVMIVGNNVNKASLSGIISSIEAEMGKEILYAYFEENDFKYRMQMYDKLIKDVLDYPHNILLDKLPLQY